MRDCEQYRVFRWIGPRVSPDRTFSKTNAPNQTKHPVLNRLPGDEMERIDKHSVLWEMFMTSSMHAAIFLGKGYSRESALCPKYRSEAICSEVVLCESTIDSRTKVGDLGSVRIELVNFQLG